MNALSQLLRPCSTEDFLQNHWTKRAIAISAKGERRFDDLFSWDTLNHLLNFHEFRYPNLRLALDEQVLDERANEKVHHWLQQGATLILDRVHQWIPAIATFTSALRYDLGYATQMNAYCSFPGKQGFTCHYDTHEVFILQIDGCKEWRVLTDTFKYPLPGQKSSALTPPTDPPYLKCVLQPGDVLYIPRGHWHYALALDEPSLHLTLGMHVKTGIDWLEWLIEQCRQQEPWRESLPLRMDKAGIDGTEVNGAGIQAQIQHLSQMLTQFLANPDRSQEYVQYLNTLGKPISAYALPQQMGFQVFPNGIATRFRPHPFQHPHISELSNELGDVIGYQIITSGKEVILKGIPRTVVEMLFRQERFTGHDVLEWLPDFDWEIDIVPLLSRLVIDGVLIVDAN
jgi:ribosomal protein L16 Arg81 hydroxylase